jgi:putative transposase
VIEVGMPRNRTGSFEPKVLPKHERRLAGCGPTILSMYARGMSTGDIQRYLEGIYAGEVRPSLISLWRRGW